jgi:hypothetical protein
MSAAPPIYRKLSGGGLSWRGIGSLWLAEDHLLEVASIVMLENYRRYFFADARAFVVRRTKVRLIWGWILGGVGATFAIVALGAWQLGLANAAEDWHFALYVPAFFFGVGALVFFVLLIINLSLGPTCRCHLLTPTGWYALSAPTRLGRANGAQAQIVSIIQSAQGSATAPAGEPITL